MEHKGARHDLYDGEHDTLAMNVSVVAEKYYGITYDPWFELLLVLSRDLTGIGLAGLCHNSKYDLARQPDRLYASKCSSR